MPLSTNWHSKDICASRNTYQLIESVIVV